MIKIELSFATFEEAAAMLARINGGADTATRAAVKATVSKPAKTEEPKAEAGNDTTGSSQKPSESPEPPAVTYDDLKGSIMKLVAIDPALMRAVCDEFGVKTFQGTAADVWGPAKAKIDAKIAERKVA